MQVLVKSVFLSLRMPNGCPALKNEEEVQGYFQPRAFKHAGMREKSGEEDCRNHVWIGSSPISPQHAFPDIIQDN